MALQANVALQAWLGHGQSLVRKEKVLLPPATSQEAPLRPSAGASVQFPNCTTMCVPPPSAAPASPATSIIQRRRGFEERARTSRGAGDREEGSLILQSPVSPLLSWASSCPCFLSEAP